MNENHESFASWCVNDGICPGIHGYFSAFRTSVGVWIGLCAKVRKPTLSIETKAMGEDKTSDALFLSPIDIKRQAPLFEAIVGSNPIH